jgi:hypothetical protein
MPRLSYNRASESLFRNPLYDLALAQTTLSTLIEFQTGPFGS